MMKFLKDITTNSTETDKHEIIRTSMAIIVGMLPLVMLWGVVMQTIAFFSVICSGTPTSCTPRTFDLMGSFQAVLAFLAGAGAFILQGGLAIFFKNKVGSDGTQTETTSITATTTK